MNFRVGDRFILVRPSATHGRWHIPEHFFGKMGTVMLERGCEQGSCYVRMDGGDDPGQFSVMLDMIDAAEGPW